MRSILALVALLQVPWTGCVADDSDLCEDAFGCVVPPVDPTAPIRIVLPGEVPAGSDVDIRIQNVGNTTFKFPTIFAACYLTYWTDDGRRFLVPPGTHCDLFGRGTIAPGETKTLFRWSLDECTEDSWGCAQEADLPPGIYHVRGDFTSSDGALVAHAGGQLRIV